MKKEITVAIKNNDLVLEEAPQEAGQLWVHFIPTPKWKKENPHLKPKIWTNAIVGQKTYPLPPNFFHMFKNVEIIFNL